MSTFATNKRWLLWLPLLAIALWLGLYANKTPNEHIVLQKSASITSRNTTTLVAASPPIMNTDAKSLEVLIDRTTLIGSDESKSQSSKWRNLFASSSWTPPTPPSKPPPPVTAQAPIAPAFPFKFVGKKFEDNTWEVFLSRGDQSFLVREGGTLEGTYRIDSITPQRLSVTYLPLGQSQSLSIGESQ
jgi:hypothetical protein